MATNTIIKTADFVKSCSKFSDCPAGNMPEYAFIGRSNVGKSSLINMLVNRNKLAYISEKPGKTTLLNYYLINKAWYLVDLPGYGYAKRSKKDRENWEKLINNYLNNRESLVCCFVLIDIRHNPQQNDLDFLLKISDWELPFVLVFTKADKIKNNQIQKNINIYQNELLKYFYETPQYFVVSSVKKTGREDITAFIENLNKSFQKNEQ